MLRKWCPGAESNHRHEDFQSTALPLSYPGTGMASCHRVADFYANWHRLSSAFFRIISGACARLLLWPARVPRHPPRQRMESRKFPTTIYPNQGRHSALNRTGDTWDRCLFRTLGRPSQQPFQWQAFPLALQFKKPHLRPPNKRSLNWICFESSTKGLLNLFAMRFGHGDEINGDLAP